MKVARLATAGKHYRKTLYPMLSGDDASGKMTDAPFMDIRRCKNYTGNPVSNGIATLGTELWLPEQATMCPTCQAQVTK